MSCNNQIQKNSNGTSQVIEIKLKIVDDTVSIFDSRETDYLLVSKKEKYPKYYEELINKYQNTPNEDSLLIVSYSFQIEKFYYDLYRNKSIMNKSSLKWASHYFKVFDTTSLSINFNHQIKAATWFKNEKQFVIVDTDNDFDFGNNRVMIYDKNFKFKDNANPNPRLIDTLPISNFRHQVFYKGKIVDVERKIKVFPYPNYYLTQLFKDEEVKKYTLFLRLKDRFEGHFLINKLGYSVFAQGFIMPRMAFIFKPDSILKMHDIVNYQYRFRDTLSLNNELYKFDSIGGNLFEIYLTKIKNEKKFFSYRMGYTMKDFMVQDLEDKQMRISEILSNKKLILLDFWGTWCAPCKELTPELKNINDEFGDSVQIISIAFDKNIDQVKKYIQDNDMNWNHLYSENRKGIINDLRITSYPTFILIDKNRKILYRGNGKFSLDHIKSNLINAGQH